MSESFSDKGPESQQPEAAAGERPHAPEIKQPGRGSRLTYSLFSSETRTGRVLRGIGRWLLTILLLVGVGMLVSYLVFSRPVEQRLRDVQARLSSVEQDLLAAQQDRSQAVEQRQQALAREAEAQEQLSVVLTRVRILRAMNSLKNAELAAQDKDGTAVKSAIDTAENILKQLYPDLDRLDPTYSSSINARFTLVRNALARDVFSSAKEIEALVSELSRMENELK